MADAAMRQIKATLYARFDEHYSQWMAVIRMVAELDCLVSLALARGNMTEPVCRPEFVHSKTSLFDAEELRHPCFQR